MASAYYFAAHFNVPMKNTDHYEEPAKFNFPSSIMSHEPSPIKQEEQNQNTSHPTARSLAGTRYVDDQEDSPFFRLPAELRNQIYAELLCPNTPNSRYLADLDSHTFKQEALHPAILRTCKKIYQEAENMLYTTNVFHAHPSLLTSFPHLTSSLKPIVDPSSIAKIKRWQFTVRLDTDPQFTMSQATAAFSGAEFLEIRVCQSMFDGCDASVLRLLTGIRGVRVARVCGSANPELAMWLQNRMMMPVEKKVVAGFCGCGDEREIRCVKCDKKVDVGEEWFAGRDAWTFGNR